MSERSDKARREFTETEAAFATVRAGLVDRLLSTTIGESVLRDKLVLTIQALDQVRATILASAQDGEFQQHIDALNQAMQTPA